MTKDIYQSKKLVHTRGVLFLHLFFSVRADYNHSFRLDWLHSSSSLSRRLSRHLHLQQQIHQHSQHQYISAANQEIKAGDKFFRTSDLQQQSMMMGADYNHSFRLDWLHSSSSLSRRLSRHLHLQQQIYQHSQHQYISAANQEIKAGDKFFRTSDLQQQSMRMGFIIQSDIDVLFVVPCFANMVDAKVPLMRFKFDEIPIDLPYAQLKVVPIPEVSSDAISLMAAALEFFISQAIVTLPNRTGVEKHPFMFSRTGVRKHPFKFPVCNYIRDEIKVKDVDQQNPTVAAMREMASELTSGMDTTLS
nr:nuclear poly(A) polymerase 3 [Ipomoea batatas]